MSGFTLDNLVITETFYGWYNKTNEIIDLLNSVVGDGISGATQDENGHLILILTDGSTLDGGYVVGNSGPGVTDAAVINGNLILTLDNGASITAGYVIGPTGETGNTGEKGNAGEIGSTGPTGEGVPTGGNIGFALVKATNDDYDTEWADVSSVARSHPGKIGGYEGGTGSLIFGRGLSQDGRQLFPRWSLNYYLSQVHQGPGISMAGSTGIYPVAGLMEGFTTGYDDGLTSGIKVLNFLENTLPFEGNAYNTEKTPCYGRTLDGPPGFYWNRMKYFPTAKLQPFYVGNYCLIDKYLGYITGYENNVNDSARRGTYAWFGIIPANSFPTGTPQSEVFQYDGFVNGSTCAYFFRDEGVGLCGNGFAVSQTDSNFAVTGYTYSAWTGDYVREVTPGRTGPIAFYPSAVDENGLGNGFVLSPGWYYLMSEFIPTSWFSVGSNLDTVNSNDAYRKGLSGDQVQFTHTNARAHHGDMSLFGLNGFELAPEGEATGVGEPFVPSSYLTISSVRQNMETIPTGLAPYLWFTQGLSGGGEGRFGGTTDTGYYLGSHIGLHQIHDTVSNYGAMTIRAQNAEQASAPRIAISIQSSASQFDSLRNVDLGTNPPSEVNFCTYTWDGLSPWGGTGEVEQFNSNQCNDCLGGTAGNRPFDWHRILFGAYQGTTAALGTQPDDVSYSSVNGSITYKIQLTCETGECPTFCAPPGFPINESITKTRISTSPVPYDVGFDGGVSDQTLWLSIGGSTTDYGTDGDVLVDPQGNIVQVPTFITDNIDDFNNIQTFRSTGNLNPGQLYEFTFNQEYISTQHGWYFPSGAANDGDVIGYNCDSHYPGSVMNPAGLTTAGATANPEEGWIKIFDDSGNAYFFGFYNGETAANLQGATTGCSECYTGHHGTSGDYGGCIFVGALPPDDGYDPDSGQGSGGGGPATISTYVNMRESVHRAWFGDVPGTEKNHLIKYTSTYGCTSGTEYSEYQGP